MKTLILYATKHGATREAAKRIAAKIPGAVFHDLKQDGIPALFDFDCVICAKNDRIIPFRSQENHWAGHKNKKILNSGHFPFYEFSSFEEMLSF